MRVRASSRRGAVQMSRRDRAGAACGERRGGRGKQDRDRARAGGRVDPGREQPGRTWGGGQSVLVVIRVVMMGVRGPVRVPMGVGVSAQGVHKSMRSQRRQAAGEDECCHQQAKGVHASLM